MAGGVTGLNHVTLAVTDVERSLRFYHDLLGLVVRARWSEGAYLETGSLWLCLAHDDAAHARPRADYSHVAFSVAAGDYPGLSGRIAATCPIWRTDRSEGASTYFLDPDGYRLEIHVGDLESRLAYYRAHPEKGVAIVER